MKWGVTQAKGTVSAKALGQVVFSARKPVWEGFLVVSSGSLRRESVGREGSLLWGLRGQVLAFGGSLRAGSRKMFLDLDAPQKGEGTSRETQARAGD